jgi:hypothetical protein
MRPLFGGTVAATTTTPGRWRPPPRPGGISAKLAYCLLVHSLALDCASGIALAAREYTADEVESLLHPVVEGGLEGSEGVPPEYPYGNVKMVGRLVQAMKGKGLAVSGRGGRAGCGGLVGASWWFSLPFPHGICFICICPVSLIMVLPPPPHSVLVLAALPGPSPRVMSRMRRSSYNYVHSEDYELGKEWKQRAMVDVEDRLFLEGMPPLMRLECKHNNHLDFRELTEEKGRVHYCCYTPSTDVQFSSSIDSSDSDSSPKSESGSSPKTSTP